MNLLFELLHGRYAVALGWTLVHSFWELAAIAGLAAIGLWMGKRWSAGARYLLACAALAIMLAAPAATFFYTMPPAVRTPPPADSVTPFSQSTSESPQPLFIEPFVWHTANASDSLQKSSWTARLSAAIEPWLPGAVALYAASLAFLLIRMGAGCWQLHRLARTGSSPPSALSLMLEKLRRRLAISRPVRLLQSARVEVPTLVGFLRPIIFLPASALTGLTADQLAAILAHELAHMRRHDYLANLLQSLIETLLFFHPAVWWLSARIRQEREHCCDDLAIATTENRLAYAKALATMESLRPAPPRIPAALAITARTGALLPRIRRILGLPMASHETRRRPPFTFSTVAMALILLTAAVYLVCRQKDSVGQTTPSLPAAVSPPALAGQTGEPLEFHFRILLVSDDFLEKLSTGAGGASDSGASQITSTLFPLRSNPAISATASISESVGDEEDKNPGGTVSKPVAVGGELLDDGQAADLLKTAQQDKKTVTVSSPRVIADSGQQAMLTVTQQQNYVHGDKVSQPPAATELEHRLEVKTLTYGLTTAITGTLSEDRKSINTELHFKNADLRGTDTFTVPDNKGFVQMPVVHNTHIDATVRIPIGQTLLLRGPTVTTQVEQDQKTAGLSDLPAVGGLFTEQVYTQENRTLLLLLTAVPAVDAKKGSLLEVQDADAETRPSVLETVAQPVIGEAVYKAPPADGATIKTEVTLVGVSPNLMDDFRIGYDINILGGIGNEGITRGGAIPEASIIDSWTLNLFLSAIQKDPRTRTLAKAGYTTPVARWVDLPIDYPALTSAPNPNPSSTEPAPVSTLLLHYAPMVSVDRKFVILTLGPGAAPTEKHDPRTPATQPKTMLPIPDGGTLFINLGKTDVPATAGNPKKSEILILLLRPNITATATEPATAPASN